MGEDGNGLIGILREERSYSEERLHLTCGLQFAVFVFEFVYV